MRKASTARAASRPSQIAHTTSDCPRRASPQAKTPCVGVAKSRVVGAHVAPRVRREAAALPGGLVGPGEAQREENEIGVHGEAAPLDLAERGLAAFVGDPLHAEHLEPPHVASAVVQEALRQHGEVAVPALLLAAGGAVDERP